jgi:hypothetical protein
VAVTSHESHAQPQAEVDDVAELRSATETDDLGLASALTSPGTGWTVGSLTGCWPQRAQVLQRCVLRLGRLR